MLVQDSRTGYFHEAPDYNVAGYAGYAGYAGHPGYGQVVYDGLGNPVGMLGPLFDMVKGAVSKIPIVGGLVSNLIPGGAPPPPSPALPMPLPALPFPAPQFPPSLPGTGSNLYPGGPPFPTTAPAPWPYRWVRSEGPLMAGQRRLYLRCTAWPGPQGLVPADATTPGLLPPMPGAPVPPGTPVRPVYRRRRHRRR